MLGLKRGTVKLYKDHENWAKLFEKEKKLLLKIFKDKIIAIEHVGSTAIPGIPAKPLIDINAAIPSLENDYINEFVAPLQKLGYTYMHQYPDRKFFAKGPEEKRTHHLNLVKINSESGWIDHILFRDYMRKNKSEANEYAALKIKLAKQFPNDRASYTKAKEKFIEDIIKKAKIAK